MNDINFVDISSKIHIFADDSVLIQSHENPTVDTEKLKTDLTTVSDYSLSLNLGLNTKKKINYELYSLLEKSSKILFPNIFINNEVIEEVQTFKYLRILIDNELRFTKHLDS